MTIRDYIRKHKNIETELLLAHELQKPVGFVYANLEKKLSDKQSKNLAIMAKKRLAGQPIAYIVGAKNFCGLEFKVNRNVLIPRPETEQLVGLAAAEIARSLQARVVLGASLKVLDMGTGSGCVAVTLAMAFASKKVLFTAVDISQKALNVAKLNSVKLKTKRIKFRQSNLFSAISEKYDLIVANLPYVTSRDYLKLKKNLRFEPKISITDNTDSWQIYRRFLFQVEKHLTPNAQIFFEIDPPSKSFLLKTSKQALPGYKVSFMKDLSGRFRFAHLSKAKG